jgi:hypothetical protein
MVNAEFIKTRSYPFKDYPAAGGFHPDRFGQIA